MRAMIPFDASLLDHCTLEMVHIAISEYYTKTTGEECEVMAEGGILSGRLFVDNPDARPLPNELLLGSLWRELMK